ncbi:TetR/AcrR family transcriptional regulator [Ferrimonas lipolytica]|uniref:TetR/AcrR family transcriptional regulator n=1 Tax=Ferrimonas lipolytica TaxID=2724191 RepID=A0A6H1UCR0_9GAMM|nr:TetR/AcrR family transcriptional regulator [Ferrimonas lipolytica]QIZ75592.1 TetR/AcrR family transcriptional regulator [Ferrimonas lipolytica]
MELTELQQRIITHAHSLIETNGITSFRFSELATIAGCSKSTLYQLFPTKEDLLCWIAISNVNDIIAYAESIADNPNLSWREKILSKVMFDIVRSWYATVPHLCLSFVIANRYVLEHACNDTISHLQKNFAHIQRCNQHLWHGAVIAGDLDCSDEEIIYVNKLLHIFQRGAVSVGMNELMRRAGFHIHCLELLTECDLLLERLNWHDTPARTELILAGLLHDLAISTEQQTMICQDPLRDEQIAPSMGDG